MPVTLERRYRFSASHRYHRPDWSEEENRRLFGKCANAPGHGHNYRLTIEVAGEPAAATGFVVDLVLLDEIVRQRILEPLDHHHLNDALAEFAPGQAIPSSENLALWIRDRLRDALPIGARLVAVKVAEEDDLAAIWRRERRTGLTAAGDKPTIGDVLTDDLPASWVVLRLRGLILDPNSEAPVVILREEQESVFLPIWIGAFEANAIAMAVEGIEPPRPMTHDLLRSVIEALGAKLIASRSSRCCEGTFHARLVVERGDGQRLEIDSRPSDALALALRLDAPIWASERFSKALCGPPVPQPRWTRRSSVSGSRTLRPKTSASTRCRSPRVITHLSAVIYRNCRRADMPLTRGSCSLTRPPLVP